MHGYGTVHCSMVIYRSHVLSKQTNRKPFLVSIHCHQLLCKCWGLEISPLPMLGFRLARSCWRQHFTPFSTFSGSYTLAYFCHSILWVFMVLKFLWPRLWATEVNEYTHTCVEDSLTGWSFSKITLASLYSGFCDLPKHGLLTELQYQEWILYPIIFV